MNDNWSKPVTVEEMYGDWDWEAAVAAVDRSLDPRPHSSIIDMFGALGPGPGDVVLDIGYGLLGGKSSGRKGSGGKGCGSSDE